MDSVHLSSSKAIYAIESAWRANLLPSCWLRVRFSSPAPFQSTYALARSVLTALKQQLSVFSVLALSSRERAA